MGSDRIHALNPGTDLKFPNDVPDDYDGYGYLVDEHGGTVALGDQDADADDNAEPAALAPKEPT
jgi:hypothetical protein